MSAVVRTLIFRLVEFRPQKNRINLCLVVVCNNFAEIGYRRKMNRTNSGINGRERQAKFVQDRISQVEKYFGFLCQTFASITRKNARLRDKSDILTNHVLSYADNENINQSTRRSLKEFAGNYGTVQDYRQTQVERLDAKVVKPLSNYGNIFKRMKNELKTAMTMKRKAVKQEEALHKTLLKTSGSSPSVTQAENELKRATEDAGDSSKKLEESMDRFEKNKITDLKKVLTDYVKIEMTFHSKALEFLTKCSQNLDDIDEQEDLEEFRNSLREFGGLQNLPHPPRETTTTLNGNDDVSPRRPNDTLTTTARDQTLTSSGMYSTDGLDDDDDDDDDLSDDDEYTYRR